MFGMLVTLVMLDVSGSPRFTERRHGKAVNPWVYGVSRNTRKPGRWEIPQRTPPTRLDLPKEHSMSTTFVLRVNGDDDIEALADSVGVLRRW
jgi:hypothetical protein